MKKLLFFTCLVLIGITLGFRVFKSDKSDLAAENLKGKVKKVVTYMRENGVDSDFVSKSIIHYNIQGNISEFSLYDIRNAEKLFLSFIYTYDKQGRKTSTSNELGEVMSTSVYGHNLKNNLTETIFSRPSKYVGNYSVYNNRNVRDSMLFYDVSGKLSGSAIYSYDASGNLTEERRYKPNSEPDSKTVYNYDSKHQKLQETRYNSMGKQSWTTFKYDDKGNVIIQVDSNVMHTGGTVGIISVHNVGPNIITRTYSYSRFDKTDNWLDRQEMINGVPYRFTKREIEYY